jgi:uncharacterized protein (DUF934 family)
MPNIIKHREVISDDWSVLRLNEGETADTVAIPEGKVIVPLAVWQAQEAALATRAHKAIWLSPDELAEDIKTDANSFEIIAIDFPQFMDGRGYSTAYSLRARLKFTGELRAIGDVLRDQLFYMKRVGFDAFAVRADKDIHDALKGLTDFSEQYQTSWDEQSPLFRRAKREAVNAG